MTKINVDGVEYDTETMTDNAKAQVASLQFLQAHMQQIQNEIAVFETAKRRYLLLLKDELEASQAKPVEG